MGKAGEIHEGKEAVGHFPAQRAVHRPVADL